MTNPNIQREYMSVTEMAEQLETSRSNLYLLIDKGVLLPPLYLIETRQPIYPRSIAERNLLVKNTCIAITGRPIKFYRRQRARHQPRSPRRSRRSSQQSRSRQRPDGNLSSLVTDLKALGLSAVTEEAAAEALAELFPRGTDGIEDGDVIRAVYRRLRR